LEGKVKSKGLSLIEILVVVAVFAILGVIATRSVLLTLRGTKKSESVVKVRENLNYALAVIERQLRNSESVACGQPGTVNYKDSSGVDTYFFCENVGPASGYIASGSARLTSSDITITACSFTCSPSDSSTLPSVTIFLIGQSVGTTGTEGSQVSVQTQIFLRTY
jgi:prepilin-type N-terminal cleavage/methylation domain-containing protein